MTPKLYLIFYYRMQLNLRFFAYSSESSAMFIALTQLNSIEIANKKRC